MNAGQRFAEKVAVGAPDECWLWLASATERGYGRFYNGERMVPAHRFAYETLVGPVPEGLTIDHLCRTRLCVNPAHLEAVTMRENTLRGIGPTALHARQTHCLHGHEFTPENTKVRPNGSRQCRTCTRAHKRRYYWRDRNLAEQVAA